MVGRCCWSWRRCGAGARVAGANAAVAAVALLFGFAGSAVYLILRWPTVIPVVRCRFVRLRRRAAISPARRPSAARMRPHCGRSSLARQPLSQRRSARCSHGLVWRPGAWFMLDRWFCHATTRPLPAVFQHYVTDGRCGYHLPPTAARAGNGDPVGIQGQCRQSDLGIWRCTCQARRKWHHGLRPERKSSSLAMKCRQP